ncbi:MAG: ABC transporter permease [Deltaproteobacteria bacterium]|nr:ABC transporter permease [Deltaproteobacteria bacterium]
MLSSLLAVIAKEFRQTFRDKRMVGLLTVAPLLQLLLLGFAVNLDVEHVPTVVADEDRSPQSRALAAELTAGDAFTHVETVESGAIATRQVARGEVPVALVIPRGFAERQQRGKPTSIQVLVDGGDSNRAIVAQNAVVGFAMSRAAGEAEKKLAELSASRGIAPSLPRVNVEPRVLYNPTLNSQIYFVPGVAATLLLIVTLITSAAGLTREKETGTLEQVMVSPIRPEILIAGKSIPYGIIGLIDLGYVLAVGTWVFDVPLRGSLWLVFLAGALYMVSTLGIGLLVSALARTQQQALMGALFFIMPAVLLSGFMTPVENMPTWLQPLSGFTPVRHFVEILRAVLLKDASFAELQAQFVALAGIGVVVFVSASRLLRRRLT